MADEEPAPAKLTTQQRAQLKRDEKLQHVQDEIDSGRMKTRKLTPEEMAEHAARRDEIQSQRRQK